MGNIIKIVLWLLIASELFCQNFSDEREKGSIGIGFQISYPFYGLSVIVAPEMDFSFQGMFGLLGKIKSYCGKVRYHIEESGVYAYALIGAKEYETTNYIDGLSEKKIETFFGYGIGFGIVLRLVTVTLSIMTQHLIVMQLCSASAYITIFLNKDFSYIYFSRASNKPM